MPVAFVQVRPETARFPESERFANDAFVAFKFVAKKFVDVAFVDVTLVNTPVDGVIAPIVVPLIAPPEIVTLEEINVGAVSVEIFPLKALMEVPDAVVKPNQLVDVPFPNERFEIEPFVITPFVVKKFVEVTLVPVPFTNVKFWREESPATLSVPVTERFDTVIPPYAMIAFEVVAPLFVIVWSVAVVAGTPLLPFDVIACPFTKS